MAIETRQSPAETSREVEDFSDRLLHVYPGFSAPAGTRAYCGYVRQPSDDLIPGVVVGESSQVCVVCENMMLRWAGRG